ncbi:hypothetical protein D9M72_579550 [compost metagenome]
MLLRPARHEAAGIDKRQERNAKGIALADETRNLPRGGGVEHPGQHCRLIRHHADRPAVDAREPEHGVTREARLQLEEVTFVHYLFHDLLHIERLRRI